MWRYFFTPEQEIPSDVGFSLYGPEHIPALVILAILSAVIVTLGCRMTKRSRGLLLKVLAALMVAMEVIKDLVLGNMGSFSVGYLPLHLCSLDMFICLYAAWHPDSDGAGQLVWALCLSGGMAALLFPDWTRFPVIHFQSIHSFVYHAMLVQFSLISVITGQIRPRVERLWKVLLFLVIAAVPIYGINVVLHTNYMFLLEPVSGTPLELCARLPGQWGYLLGYLILAAAILVVLTLPFSLWARYHKHISKQ